jgi:amino-acid N-acetyltransferase
MENVTVRAAIAADLPAIRALLAACSLPHTDLEHRHLDDFFVGCAEGAVMATVGLERFGDVALLRSLAVAEEARGRGLARALWQRALARARDKAVVRLYLLTTTTAAPLFEHWAFVPIAREDVPAIVHATSEFTTLCPSSAVVMTTSVHWT